MCYKAGFILDNEEEKFILQYFEAIYNERNINFANAREVRNLFEKSIVNQDKRLSKLTVITDEILTRLAYEDVSKTLSFS
jgi:hypothetical protein